MTNQEWKSLKDGDAFWAYDETYESKELEIYRMKGCEIFIADNWEDSIYPKYLIIVNKIETPTKY